MKLLIGTNIVLDVLLKREPFYQDAVKVTNLAQYDDVCEYMSASAVTDIYYIAYKLIKDRKLVLDLIKRLLMVVSIAAVTEFHFMWAICQNMSRSCWNPEWVSLKKHECQINDEC